MDKASAFVSTMFNHFTVIFALLVGVHSEFVVLGRRDTAPPGFSPVGSSPAGEVLTLRLALAQSNVQGLEDTVYDISTPGSPRYGQYLTQAEVMSFVVQKNGRPSDATPGRQIRCPIRGDAVSGGLLAYYQ